MPNWLSYSAGLCTCPFLWLGVIAAFVLWWAVRRYIEKGR